jgi:DNA polymerase III delta subunit
MIHLFHGDNIYLSRKELLNFREKFKDQEIIIFDEKNLSLTDLKQATESNSMFGNNRLVIIENFFVKKFSKKVKDNDENKFFLKNLSDNIEIVFWEEKEINKTSISLLPKSIDIALFQIDKLLFKFLESLKTNNTLDLIDRYNHCIEKDSPEMIFAMLVRHLRYLIMVKDIGKNVTELSPWQLGKFIKQADIFDLRKLILMYNKLLQIDIKIKTSLSPFNLTDELRLFLIDI